MNAIVEQMIAEVLRASTRATEIMRELGVSDLPPGAKSKFALALKAERSDDPIKAFRYLDEAIQAENAYRGIPVQ